MHAWDLKEVWSLEDLLEHCITEAYVFVFVFSIIDCPGSNPHFQTCMFVKLSSIRWRGKWTRCKKPSFEMSSNKMPFYKMPSYKMPFYKKLSYKKPTYKNPSYKKPSYQITSFKIQIPSYKMPVWSEFLCWDPLRNSLT